MTGHEHLYYEADDVPMACPAPWCEWNDPHLHYPETADGPEFPEYFQGAGPVYAAIPLGNPWLDVASRGETTFVVEGPLPADMPEEEAVSAHRAYAGHSAFLDRADAEVMADARDGTFTRWAGLDGWSERTPVKAAAEAAGLDEHLADREAQA